MPSNSVSPFSKNTSPTPFAEMSPTAMPAIFPSIFKTSAKPESSERCFSIMVKAPISSSSSMDFSAAHVFMSLTASSNISSV